MKFFFFYISLFLVGNSFAQQVITVGKKGKVNFKTIQAAINSLPTDAKQERIILIKNGVYNEKIFIDKNFVTLKGENQEKTVVEISQARDEWRCTNPNDYGTAAINLKGSDINLENITFINSYGKNAKLKKIVCTNDSGKQKEIRPDAHQMTLRSFETTRLKATNCTFIAYGGDTVSPWNTEDGMFFFKNCTMQGGVDFYCPRGWALAEDCTFICNSKEAAIWHDGSKFQNSKTVLVNCNFKGSEGFVLGRYHRDAQFYLINCNFAKEMADIDIFQKGASPPNNLQWGRRVYYYNCNRATGSYAWHKDNIPNLVLDKSAISVAWVYDDKWLPVSNKVYIPANVLLTNVKPKDTTPTTNSSVDKKAEIMLAMQRNYGGWPKHFNEKAINYDKNVFGETELAQINVEKGKKDATIDNNATTKEIRHLVKAYKTTKNKSYLEAAENGIKYLLKMQYKNGGFPQFYPDLSGYKHQITFNDNAMVNALNVLQDIVEKKNDFDVVDSTLIPKCDKAVKKGLEIILQLQIKQKGTLTAWCAQYDDYSLEPDMARKFELASISGQESVGIVEFLMRQPNPDKKIITAVNSAVQWFEKSKIYDVDIVDIEDKNQASGKDRVLIEKKGNVLWARFYDLETNKPFFTGRNSEKMFSLDLIENERRIGYAYYGAWATRLLNDKYNNWKTKNNL